MRFLISVVLMCLALLCSAKNIALYEKGHTFITIINNCGAIKKKISLLDKKGITDFYLNKDVVVVSDNQGKIFYRNIKSDKWILINKEPFRYPFKKWGHERFINLFMSPDNKYLTFLFGPEFEKDSGISPSYKRDSWGKGDFNRILIDIADVGVYSFIDGSFRNITKNLGGFNQSPFIIGNKTIYLRYTDVVVRDLKNNSFHELKESMKQVRSKRNHELGLLGVLNKSVILGEFNSDCKLLKGIYLYDLTKRQIYGTYVLASPQEISWSDVYDADVEKKEVLYVKGNRVLCIFNYKTEQIRKILKTKKDIVKVHFVKI